MKTEVVCLIRFKEQPLNFGFFLTLIYSQNEEKIT